MSVTAVLVPEAVDQGGSDDPATCTRQDVAPGAEDTAQVPATDPNYTGPLDCYGHGCAVTGIRCHGECECRHLDNIERSRFYINLFRYPRRPRLVICASRDGRGTASTWAFNAVRLLFRQAREACDSYWIRVLTVEKLRRRLATGTHVVVKTHEWTQHISKESFEEMLPFFTHVILSRREGREDDPAWMSVATFAVAFEDVVVPQGALLVLRGLAEQLGLGHFTDVDLRAVDTELMSFPIPHGYCNQTTKFWPHHARRGGRSLSALDSS